MPQAINCTFSIAISGGPTQSLARTITVDAYDVLYVTVPAATAGRGAGPGTATIAVQPSSDPGKVMFLLLSSSLYDAGLTCEVDGGSTIKLDSPQILIGASIDVLMGAVPENFTFSNPLPDPALITIIVGRKA